MAVLRLLVLIVSCCFCLQSAAAFLAPQAPFGVSRSSSSSTATVPTIGTSTTTTRFPSSASTSAATTALFATYKKVFVAGGSRGVGRSVIDKLVAKNVEVVALVRDASMAQELNQLPGVTAVQGDAYVIKDVENAMDGCDAAITTLGGSSPAAASADGDANAAPTKRIDYEGNNHVIESAGILGVTRVILVTSIGCGSSKEAAPPAVFEVLKDVLQAKEKAENILIRYYTNMNWTIIRPGGLKSEPMTGAAILTEDNSAIGSIHREDVADLVVQALESPSTERKVLSAIDPSITSAVSMEGKTVAAFAL